MGDVGRQDVEQQTLVVLPQLLHVLHFLPRLETPQEVQPRRRLQLPTKKQFYSTAIRSTELSEPAEPSRTHLSAVVEHGYHKHHHENDTNSFLAQVMRPERHSGVWSPDRFN